MHHLKHIQLRILTGLFREDRVNEPIHSVCVPMSNQYHRNRFSVRQHCIPNKGAVIFIMGSIFESKVSQRMSQFSNASVHGEQIELLFFDSGSDGYIKFNCVFC